MLRPIPSNNSVAQDSDKNTALTDILTAVNEGNFPALEKCVEQHLTANLNIQDRYGRTLLDIAYTRKLNYQIAIAQEKNQEGREMAFALKKENEKIFRLLLEKSDINARTINNQTLLHVAVTGKAPLVDIVLFLVKGADPKARDRAKKRPVDYLLDKRKQLKDDDMAHAKNLLEKGIDYLFEPENETILQDILQYWKDNNSSTEYNAFHTLLKDTQDNNGDTILLRSIKNKNTHFSKRLIEQGVSLHLTDKEGNNALLLAIQNGQTEIVKLLLAKGVDPDSQNNQKFTALMLAATRGHYEIIKILLAHGADPNIQRPSAFLVYNAVSDAVIYGHNEIAKELITAGGASEGLLKWNGIAGAIDGPIHSDLRKIRKEILAAKDYIHFLLAKVTDNQTLEELSSKLKYPAALEKLAVYALQQNRPDIIMAIIQANTDKPERLTFLTKEPVLQATLNYLRHSTLSSPSDTLAMFKKIKDIDINNNRTNIVIEKSFLNAINLEESDLNKLVAIQQQAEQWIGNNKNNYPLTGYVTKLETEPNNQVALLDQIIDGMNIKSSHNRYLEITSLQKTTLRHAIAQRIYERSRLEDSNNSRIDLSHLLKEKDNMLIKWLKTPTNTGITGGLSRLWKGSTNSFRWLQAAPAHLLGDKKKITKK